LKSLLSKRLHRFASFKNSDQHHDDGDYQQNMNESSYRVAAGQCQQRHCLVYFQRNKPDSRQVIAGTQQNNAQRNRAVPQTIRDAGQRTVAANAS
jgi:hypothetical protein